jgi:hypothetical protein
VAQFTAIDAGGPARNSRPDRRLDLHLHQLAAYAAYVRAWADKYRNQGLVVIGVHSPEFAFEKNVDNIRRAAKDMRVDYPIAIDSDFAIWRALKDEYWPALYIVDAHGRIRHHQFGEGGYEQSERIMQQLLAEAGDRGIGHDLVSVDARGAEASADWETLLEFSCVTADRWIKGPTTVPQQIGRLGFRCQVICPS